MYGDVSVLDASQLTNLQVLHFCHGSQLIGKLDPNFYCQLTTLNLWGNMLTGSLPESIQCMNSQLQNLNLYGNSLTGPIPESFIQSLPNLRQFVVSRNSFSGTIPAAFKSLSFNLTRLDLDGNLLTGSVPSYLSMMIGLDTLTLNGNSFTGMLPDLSALSVSCLGFGLTDMQDIPVSSMLPATAPAMMKISHSGVSSRALQIPGNCLIF